MKTVAVKEVVESLQGEGDIKKTVLQEKGGILSEKKKERKETIRKTGYCLRKEKKENSAREGLGTV